MRDIFSHRLDSYNVGQVQFAIAGEDLIRKNMGRVSRHLFAFKALEDADLDKLLASMGEIGTRLDEYETAMFFDSKSEWHCRMIFDTTIVDGEDFATADEGISRGGKVDTDEGVRKRINKIHVEIVMLSNDIVDTIKQKGKEAGFVPLENMEAASGVPVTFAFPGARGIDYNVQSFEGIPLDSIRCNYNENVMEQVDEFIKRARKSSKGIVLINGPVGTGKSYLIRAVLTELNERRAVICSPPTKFLAQAGLLSQVAANFSKSMVVLEDIGEVIAADSATVYSDARANLLNFAEGFLSLLMDAIVVVSFNYELSKIDPAILRPGRCLANIIVDELPFDRAQDLVDFNIPNRKYTLAEIYEIRRVGNVDGLKAERKIGFVR